MKENILPAIRNMRDLEKLIKTDYKACVVLDMHIGHLKSIMELLKSHSIECYVHIDLIKGLSHDNLLVSTLFNNINLKVLFLQKLRSSKS